ncbi:MAG: MFS transporter [Candidatus Hodarchaeales archaeon]
MNCILKLLHAKSNKERGNYLKEKSPSITSGKISAARIPLKYPEFGKLLVAQIISNTGSQFSYVALQFLVYELTQSVFIMALLAIAEVLPMILIGPWAGVIVDKFDRKHVMSAASVVQACAVGLIPVTVIFGEYRVLFIMLLAFVNSTGARFFFPARGASIPKLVDKEHLFSANSLSAASFQLTLLIGPVFAGMIIALSGYDLPFMIDSVSFITGAVIILTMKTNLKVENSSTPETIRAERNPLNDLKEGLRFAINFPPVLYIVAIFSLLMFFGGSTLMMIIPYLEEELGLTEKGIREMYFGIISGMSALVGLVFAIIISKKKELSRPLKIMTSTLILVAFILFTFSLAKDLLTVALIWTSFGMVQVFIGIPLQTLTQLTVPDHLRGKIFSFLNLSISTAQILGMGMVGVLATFLGIRPSFLVNSFLLLFSAFVCLVFLRKRDYDSEIIRKRKELGTMF